MKRPCPWCESGEVTLANGELPICEACYQDALHVNNRPGAPKGNLWWKLCVEDFPKEMVRYFDLLKLRREIAVESMNEVVAMGKEVARLHREGDKAGARRLSDHLDAMVVEAAELLKKREDD
jgi:hypothetical protein